MKTLIVLLALNANAKTSTKFIYMNDQGKKVDATQAVMWSINNETIYKCQEVEAVPSKSGNSVTLKSKKVEEK